MDGRVNNSGTKGNKGGGRRTMAEELKRYKEGLKRASIEELAESKLYNHLKEHVNCKDKQGLKDIALPVYLKSKADKKEVTANIKVSGFNFIKPNEDSNPDN